MCERSSLAKGRYQQMELSGGTKISEELSDIAVVWSEANIKLTDVNRPLRVSNTRLGKAFVNHHPELIVTAYCQLEQMKTLWKVI